MKKKNIKSFIPTEVFNTRAIKQLNGKLTFKEVNKDRNDWAADPGWMALVKKMEVVGGEPHDPYQLIMVIFKDTYNEDGFETHSSALYRGFIEEI